MCTVFEATREEGRIEGRAEGIIEAGASFGNGSNIIYVNGSYKNGSDPVGRLMHDFRCVSSVEFYPALGRFSGKESRRVQNRNFVYCY